MIVKILAFMPNPWFLPGTPKEEIYRYKTVQEFRQMKMKETITGVRLINAFGEEMFNRIIWDSVAPEASDDPRIHTPVNMNHVEAMIAVHRPDLILTFGLAAEEALKKCAGSITRHLMYCHHPNARYKPQYELDDFAQKVWDWVLLMERKDEFTKHDES